MTEYEDSLGLMHFNGQLFACPCGVSEFMVEVGPEPVRYWCSCGKMYTEAIVFGLMENSG